MPPLISAKTGSIMNASLKSRKLMIIFTTRKNDPIVHSSVSFHFVSRLSVFWPQTWKLPQPDEVPVALILKVPVSASPLSEQFISTQG